MNAMVNNVPLFSFLKVISPDKPNLDDLVDFRALLSGKKHSASNVGETGINWLRSFLSADVVEDIRKFTRSNHKVLLMRGIDISTDVSSPDSGFLNTDQCVLDFDLLLFGMLELLGVQPYAVEYENYGRLVRNVVPVKEAVGMTSSWGADVDFSWHTDNPNWPFLGQSDDIKTCIPEYLAFTAIRNIEGAPTDIVYIDNVLEKLSSWVIEQLERPAYRFLAPVSNESFHGQARILPILEYSGCGYRMRFDEGVISATDPDGKEALDILIKCLNETQGICFNLEPGDFIILKNTQVLHRRKAFTPEPDGKSRWLRRIYGN